MADKIKPKVKLKCKWCGEKFITELSVPIETKGELKCSHCNHTAIYSPDDLLEP